MQRAAGKEWAYPQVQQLSVNVIQVQNSGKLHEIFVWLPCHKFIVASRLPTFVVPSSDGSFKQASAAIAQLHHKFKKAIPFT